MGSYDREGRPNLMTAAWARVSCSEPPCAGVSISAKRYTYEDIARRKAFTISVPSEDYLKEADYLGIASGRNEDKFKTLGLTPVASDLMDAPYVAEFVLVLECRLKHSLECLKKKGEA